MQLIPTKWKDYELLDSGDRMKLERWGQFIVSRPDPQALWPQKRDPGFWTRAHAVYSDGGRRGNWAFTQKLPHQWKVKYGDLSFWVRPTDSKHTGLFPEQAVNWEWLVNQVKCQISNVKCAPKVLNLFGYTGGATLAMLSTGADVTHVDAAEGMIDWAKENAELSGLHEKPVRWIVEDVLKCVSREERRGVKYDGIIMDPPSYGRGRKNELWKIEEMLLPLVQKCEKLLSDKPLFFVVNSYTTGLQTQTVENILQSVMGKRGGNIEAHELGLKPRGEGWVLPTGSTVRWSQ